MRHLLAKNNGFTLFELLMVMVMLGILAAVGIPSLLGIINASRVRDAQAQVQGIIRGAQRQAIRSGSISQICELQFNISSNPITITDTQKAACLTANTLELPKNVKILTDLSGTPPKLAFNFKGRSNKAGTIVFYSDQANQKRCLVISLYLGMMRTGEYTGSVTDPLDPTSCNTTADSL